MTLEYFMLLRKKVALAKINLAELKQISREKNEFYFEQYFIKIWDTPDVSSSSVVSRKK